MADEKTTAEEEGKKKSSLVPTLIIGLVVVVVPCVLAIILWMAVLKPLTSDETEPKVEMPTDLIPATHVMTTFDSVNVPILPDDPETAAPLLQYQIAFACSDLETQTLIDAHKEWFVAKISEMHQNKTRSELNDPYVKNTLKKQIRQEANTLIKRLSPDAQGEVIEVLYLNYGIMDI